MNKQTKTITISLNFYSEERDNKDIFGKLFSCCRLCCASFSLNDIWVTQAEVLYGYLENLFNPSTFCACSKSCYLDHLLIFQVCLCFVFIFVFLVGILCCLLMIGIIHCGVLYFWPLPYLTVLNSKQNKHITHVCTEFFLHITIL